MNCVARRAGDLLTLHGWKRLLTEGHTVVDAILTVAMAQIVSVSAIDCSLFTSTITQPSRFANSSNVRYYFGS